MYDIADLYKAEISIPAAFETTAQEPDDIGSATRYAMRDSLYDLSLLDRMVSDIKKLLGAGDDVAEDGDRVALWDEKLGEVPAGCQYADGSEG